jgi:chorismate synthase
MLRYLTAGESHGKALTAIIDGMVAGLPIDEDYIARELARRQGGYGRGGRMKIEKDRAEIVSGVRHGMTIGSPISLLIQNRDWENWKDAMSVASTSNKGEPVTRLRPGHADLTGVKKYGLDDVRPVLERASARGTAARVAVGAIARRFLEEFGIEIKSHTVAIGGVRIGNTGIDKIDWNKVEKSPVRCSISKIEKAMIAAIDAARDDGDSVGGIFQIVATGVPIGLGSHVHWDRRLDGRIAQAMMSINAVKSVEIGNSSSIEGLKGSLTHDVIRYDKTKREWSHATNHAGGIEGGISNGASITVQAMIKPIPTLAKPLPSVDLKTGKSVKAHIERSDVCVVPAAGVIGEGVLAIVLANAMMEKFGGDHLTETKRNFKSYLKTI